MPGISGDPAGYAFAFEEGKRALNTQAEVLKETRDRVGTVVSAAAVVAALGSGLAFNNAERIERLSAWGGGATAVAAVAFLVVSFAAAAIWRPFSGAFVADAGILVGSYVEGADPASIPEIHRDVALHLGLHAQHNTLVLERRLQWFTAAITGFVVEVFALSVVVLDVA